VVESGVIFKNFTLCSKQESQVLQAIKFWLVAPNICVFSIWNLLHITLLVPTILRWLLDF